MPDDVGKFAVHPEDWGYLSDQLQQETDRGAALVGAAFLDALLAALIEAFMIENPSLTNRLLSGPTAPFGAFSSRIDGAYALGLISEEEHHDLGLIRRIRNDFAHLADPITYSTQSVESRVKQLRIPQLSNQIFDTSGLSLRQLFINAVSMIATFLEMRSRRMGDRREEAPKFYIQAFDKPK